jgi:hypothetical protein
MVVGGLGGGGGAGRGAFFSRLVGTLLHEVFESIDCWCPPHSRLQSNPTATNLASTPNAEAVRGWVEEDAAPDAASLPEAQLAELDARPGVVEAEAGVARAACAAEVTREPAAEAEAAAGVAGRAVAEVGAEVAQRAVTAPVSCASASTAKSL